MGRKSGRSRDAEYWQGIFVEWRSREMTQQAFCQEKQLSYTTFYYWYRKLILKHGSEKIHHEENKPDCRWLRWFWLRRN
jgi:hypothetical protein